jgi:hypothetical protein
MDPARPLTAKASLGIPCFSGTGRQDNDLQFISSGKLRRFGFTLRMPAILISSSAIGYE